MARRYTINNNMFLALFVLVLSLPGLLHARGTADVSLIDVNDFGHQQARQREQLVRDIGLPEFDFSMPSRSARVSLQSMFSAQHGSWPFEPFVHAGLFEVIAKYQSHHPRILSIDDGRITLQELHRQLNDDHVLRRHEDGYLLSYPVMINSGGALIVENTKLYLYRYSGSAIINRGLLQVDDAELASYEDKSAYTSKHPYRPFVINWAGSQLHISNSIISGLGYEQHLSRGVTAARSMGQNDKSIVPARIQIHNSKFTEMVTGVEVSESHARITDSNFSHNYHYALDLDGSLFYLSGNEVNTVTGQSGIRIRGNSHGEIADNRVIKTAKSAIEVDNFDGQLLVNNNRLGMANGYGIRLSNTQFGSRLWIEGNLIFNTLLSGIDGVNAAQITILNNRIVSTPEYAISIRNIDIKNSSLSINGNKLEKVGKAMIQMYGVGQLTLGENSYRARPLLQNLLIGDLLPYQTSLLEITLRERKVARLMHADSNLIR